MQIYYFFGEIGCRCVFIRSHPHAMSFSYTSTISDTIQIVLSIMFVNEKVSSISERGHSNLIINY